MLRDILFIIVIFFANMLQAVTGFAGTLLAMPPSIKLIGVDEAKFVLNVITQISGLMIVCTGFRDINWKEFAKMFTLMSLGMFVGLKIFDVVPTRYLMFFYGVMIILIALKKIFVKREWDLPKVTLLVILFLAGIIHGMFVSGGSLLVIYAVTALKDKREFRATIALIWVVIGCYITGGMVIENSYTSHGLILLALSVIPLVLATWIGTKLVSKIPQAVFMKITYVLLLVSGVLAII